jgi:hypothetical protein
MESSYVIPRSYDRVTNPEALGVSIGRNRNMLCVVLVSRVGVSNLWCSIRKDSGSFDHVPNHKHWQERVLLFGTDFNVRLAVEAVRAQVGVELVGTDCEEARRVRAFQWAVHTRSFTDRWLNSAASHNPLAAFLEHFWRQARLSSDGRKLESDDDLTPVYAVLNGLVALEDAFTAQRAAVAQAAEAAQEADKQFWEELRELQEGSTVRQRVVYQGRNVEIASDKARELVARGWAKFA